VIRGENASEIIQVFSAVNHHKVNILPGLPQPNVADAIKVELQEFCSEHGMNWSSALQFFAYEKKCTVAPGREISAYQAVFSSTEADASGR